MIIMDGIHTHLHLHVRIHVHMHIDIVVPRVQYGKKSLANLSRSSSSSSVRGLVLSDRMIERSQESFQDVLGVCWIDMKYVLEWFGIYYMDWYGIRNYLEYTRIYVFVFLPTSKTCWKWLRIMVLMRWLNFRSTSPSQMKCQVHGCPCDWILFQSSHQ